MGDWEEVQHTSIVKKKKRSVAWRVAVAVPSKSHKQVLLRFNEESLFADTLLKDESVRVKFLINKEHRRVAMIILPTNSDDDKAVAVQKSHKTGGIMQIPFGTVFANMKLRVLKGTNYLMDPVMEDNMIVFDLSGFPKEDE